MPRLMEHLPIDPDRGYVVPWFVAWINNKPEFRATDWNKYTRALKNKLCWVCGTLLPTRFAFVSGPMCGINRVSAEPPSHVACGSWSARNCPFLSNPDMVRREDQIVNKDMLISSAPGMCVTRNPGVAMVWITREFEVFDDGAGKPLIGMGRPQEVEWYCRGRSATRREVLDSIENGLPALEAVARTEAGGLEALARKRQQFERWLPGK